MKIFEILFGLHKTIFINFKYFKISEALKLPVIISKNTKIKSLAGTIKIKAPLRTGLIKIGFGEVGVFDKSKSKSILEIRGELVFTGKANIGHGSKLCVMKNGYLELGDNFVVTAESTIISDKKIIIGQNVLLSWDILIMDTDFHKIYKDGIVINEPKEIIIEDNVWIGCRAVILKGSVVAKNSVIAANSCITKPLTNSNSIYGGNPVKMLKEDIRWSV